MGGCPAMVHVRHLAEAAAHEMVPVLFLGETGTGKGYLAAHIHARSPRAAGPFVHVMAATLSPSALDESSPASSAVVGAARGGTLFIDEVAELSPAAQGRLLHLLERLGRTDAPDIRVFVATNREPGSLAVSSTFRRDLFFRLGALVIGLPPLRERAADIPQLARALLREGTRAGRPAPELSADAEDALVRYAWPGNVRQLKSELARAAIAADHGIIRRDHFWLPAWAPPPIASEPPPSERRTSTGVRRIDRALVVDALAQHGGNQSEAARQLGVSRRTLINRLEEFELPRPRKRTRSDPG
jgi:DNA-binding NtrC family response regulator